jgi:hypothetical protein
MSRRNFATVDAVLVVIFAGGVFAQTGAPFTSTKPRSAIAAGDRP